MSNVSTGPELRISIQTDQAWSRLTRTMAYTAPKHLHNAQLARRQMVALRSKS